MDLYVYSAASINAMFTIYCLLFGLNGDKCANTTRIQQTKFANNDNSVSVCVLWAALCGL